MKLSLMLSGCGAAVMTAAMLFAQTEEKPPFNPVELYEEENSSQEEAAAEPSAQPTGMSADEFAQKAAETSQSERSPVANARVTSLPGEGYVIPPSAEIANTVEDAVRNVLAQAGKQIGTVSTNGIEKLVMPYQQLGDGRSYREEWRKVLRLLLTPQGYNFTEDGELVLFGLFQEVEVKHKHLAQERLSANRTPILFTTNDAEGGMDLRTAIRDISLKAGVQINTDYMVQSDLSAPKQLDVTKGEQNADDFAKKTAAAQQQSTVKRTTFDTNGQQIEWRTVLQEILHPNGYGFVEVDGVVRIAKYELIKKWEDDKVAEKPLTAKVIRLYHADPEAVVERVMKIKGLLKHPNASLQATRKKDDNTEVVKNLNARINTSSGSQSGMSDTTSQVFDKLVRPRTIPAIIAYDIEENMDEIEKKIRLFDIKEKQILIEAMIFQLETDNDADGDGEVDGIKWSGLTEGFSPLYGAISGAGTFTGVNGTEGFSVRKGNQVWMRTDGIDFQTWIQLIRKKNNAKLLSNPMLVIGDHSEAAIQVSQVDPVPDPESNFSDTQTATRETVNLEWLMIRSGVLLWVAPEITENGTSVRMTVHPQVVSKLPAVTFSYGGTEYFNYPLKMHEMDTRATVPSGATLMFGGLVDNEESEVEEKVRWLGDIPVLGWFFRWKTTKIRQKNLVIMIRPTILEDTEETGFEKNAIKEIEPMMKNSGRDMKKTPLEGPYSVKETEDLIKDLYNERVVKPFVDEGESEEEEESEETDAAEPAPLPQDNSEIVPVAE